MRHNSTQEGVEVRFGDCKEKVISEVTDATRMNISVKKGADARATTMFKPDGKQSRRSRTRVTRDQH